MESFDLESGNESIGQVVPTDPKNRLVLARRATF
jgi:hypothetical protein